MQMNESRRTEPDRRQALLEERILILASSGTDAQVILAAAVDGGFTAEAVADVASLCTAIVKGAGAVVLVEADFSPADVSALRSPQFQWTGREGLPGLRGYAYGKQEGRQARVTLHLLNYDLDATHDPEPVRDLPVSVALPAAFQHVTLGKLSAFAPDSSEALELQGEVRNGRLYFALPELRVYRLVEALLTAT